MRSKTDNPFMMISFCCQNEKAFNADYEWHGQNRGRVPYVILQWTLSGSGEFRTQERNYVVGPGQAFVSVVPEPTSYRFPPNAKDPWVFSWMNIIGDFSVGLWRRFCAEFGPVNPLPAGSPAGMAVAHIAAARSAGLMQDTYELNVALFQFYNLWWRQLAGTQIPEPGIARVAKQYFDENYAEPVNVKELAARAGCSREHFTRLFIKETGQSPALYLRWKRLEAGRKLLKEGILPVAEIARRCGFASARQFRRAYEVRHGRVPFR